MICLNSRSCGELKPSTEKSAETVPGPFQGWGLFVQESSTGREQVVWPIKTLPVSPRCRDSSPTMPGKGMLSFAFTTDPAEITQVTC